MGIKVVELYYLFLVNVSNTMQKNSINVIENPINTQATKGFGGEIGVGLGVDVMASVRTTPETVKMSNIQKSFI